MTTETNDFNRSPILNSPYERPMRHWAFVELDDADFFGASDLAALVDRARAAYDAKLKEVMK